MKNLSKQTKQLIMLSGLVLVLLVSAMLQFTGKKPHAAAPPPATAAPAPTPAPGAATPNGTAESSPENDTMDWVDSKRLATIMDEVIGGRNPFVNMSLPARGAMPPQTTRNPSPALLASPRNTGATAAQFAPLPVGDQSLPERTSTSVKLRWASVAEVRARLQAEKLNISTDGSDAGRALLKLAGDVEEVGAALELVKALDVEPPLPAFKLLGVVEMQQRHLVVLSVGDTLYRVFEGEPIPKLGWTVTSITPEGAALSNGRQSVRLHF